MGAPDLNHLTELIGLLLNRVAHARDRRNEFMLQRSQGGDRHSGREHVVGRLTSVDVIIRMNDAFYTSFCTKEFTGAIRDHLVHIHVRLRAAARLPYDQWELVVVPSIENFLCSVGDGLS